MKGQAKRLVDHKGQEYPTDTGMIDPPVKDRNASIGFFDLWRYSTLTERLVTVLGVLLSWCCSCGVISAVVVYGEITAMFVARHKAESADNQVRILKLFGGGRVIPDGDRPLHMDALVEDSIAFAWASVAVMLLQFSAAAASVTLSSWAAKRTCERLRWRLLEAVLRQESAFFDTNTSMNFATTLTEDMEKFRAGVGEHVSMTAYLGGSVVCGVATALVYGWQLALVGLAFVPVAVVVAVVVAKYQTKSSAAEVGAYSKAGRTVEEALANIRTVRAYAGEAVEVKRYSEALIPAAFASLRRGIWAGLGAGLGWLLTYAMIAAVFAYGAALCARDLDLPVDMRAYNPAVMITVLFCTFMSAQNVAMCHPHLEIFSNARGAARSLYRLLERKSLIDALGDQGTRPDRFRGDIEFDNLYFNYPSRPDVKVLRGLTLSIRAGETVALVGGSGCGKSTLLQLLQRMYEPDSGSVTVDGVRLEDLNIHHYRTSIGVVGQEPVLFAGSIRDNITIGLTDVPESDVIEAAKTAHAHQFITKLADGYNTMLGERGAQLSGGQKQRIAIARAVLRRPAILLLDEPTSALDPHAERQVQAALDAAARGRTTLTVSHRLSTIVNASRIVYMEQGAALEQGSHDELMAKKGLYWKLVQEDLTNKSITNALAAPAESEEADDQVPPTPEPRKDPFRRSISRASVLSASLSRESAVRSSRRLGSVSSAHLRQNLPAPDSIPEEEEGDEKVPPVSLLQILRLNRAEWPLLAGGGASSFLIGGTMPLFALFFSKLYGMLSSSDKDEIIRESRIYAGLFGAVAALCGLVTFLQAWLFNRAGAKLTDRLRVDTFTNYLKQEQGWFDRTQNSVGALCARLASDAAAVQGATGTPLGTVLQGVSTMVIGVGLAMPYSWKMTLVSLLSVPCVIGGIWLEGVVTRRAEDNERRALEHASRVATEAVLNVKTVHSLGVESTILSRYRSALASARARTGRMAGVRGAVYGLCLCAPTLGYAVSLAYGGYLIAREGLSYEYAILVSEALIYGAWMLAEALSFAPSFAAARRAAARVLAALRRQPAIVTEDTAVFDPTWSASGDLEFSHLDFSYPSRPSAAVLRGLTLTVRRGQSVALVGASGCGKSTLMHLLMRSYDPSNGTVKMDGVDIKRSLTLPQLRAQLGLVAQEPALFERSIRDNIAYGDTSRHVSTEEVIKAATQANVHQFISSLPLGYETRLGAGGAALSGGQKQRVAIARALVRDPRVLLLDEATSALDANSEKTVQAALEAASKDRTTIIIAHRLATVQHADVICVIDRGVVAESGSHEELVRKRGLYWELLQQQAPTS